MAPRATLLVAIIGVGLIGKEVVSQILSIPSARNPFKIVFLASSRKALYAPTPLLGNDWEAALDASSETPDLKGVATYLTGLVARGQGRQAVIVDNTSSEDVANLYASWLKAGVHVATPNKKAFSGNKATWDAILAASNEENAGRWLNESTVGAGLPVINTLKEMLGSGDRVRKIEGVFSGTLSYIFNEWSHTSPSDARRPAFSDVVKSARDMGYTKPYPTEDLKGEDVGRKRTILARIVSEFTAGEKQGNFQELQSFLDVHIQSLVSKPLEECTTGDEILQKLPAYDADFERLRQDAESEGMVLRFTGVLDIENGVVQAALQKYPATHPFAASLGRSDNIVIFHTERYSPRPLIIQGPTGGPPLTAMGVLCDLLKLA